MRERTGLRAGNRTSRRIVAWQLQKTKTGKGFVKRRANVGHPLCRAHPATHRGARRMQAQKERLAHAVRLMLSNPWLLAFRPDRGWMAPVTASKDRAHVERIGRAGLLCFTPSGKVCSPCSLRTIIPFFLRTSGRSVPPRSLRQRAAKKLYGMQSFALTAHRDGNHRPLRRAV